MEKLIDWCRFNKLALNSSKCEYMLLTNKHVVHQPNTHLLLKRAHSFKYLRIYLDDKVKFNAHVDYFKSRLSQYCGITFRLIRYFNTKTAKTMHYACIFSLVTHCITVG